MKTLIVVFVVFITSLAWAGWEYAQPGDQLKYNPMENQWQYAKPDAQLKYNPMEQQWDYVEPGEQLRFNSLNNQNKSWQDNQRDFGRWDWE